MDIYVAWRLTTSMTLGKRATEGITIKAWSIASVDHGRTHAYAATRIRAFLVRVLAVNPTAFRARLRDVPNVDFVGEPRSDRGHSGPHWYDHLRERRVREVVHIRRAEGSTEEGGEVE